MSGTNSFMADILGKLRESASSHVDDAFVDGYIQAANDCMQILSRSIDGLINQVQSGRYLSEHEQFLLASLTKIRSEVEAAFREFLDNSCGE